MFEEAALVERVRGRAQSLASRAGSDRFAIQLRTTTVKGGKRSRIAPRRALGFYAGAASQSLRAARQKARLASRKGCGPYVQRQYLDKIRFTPILFSC